MLKIKWTVSAAMTAALALIASTAGAQSPNYRGSFTLPFEARFGNLVLEPGAYSVSTLTGAQGIRVAGKRKTFSLLSAGYDIAPQADKGKLILVEADGMYALESLELATMGKTMHFLVTKNKHKNTETAGLAQRIEVAMQ